MERNLIRSVGFTAMSLLLAACAQAGFQKNTNVTPTMEPTPAISPTDIPAPILPTETATLIPQPTPISTPTEIPTTKPPEIVCKYYSGSSSYNRLGGYLFKEFNGEKTVDESKNYSVITMKESDGNMVIFISKGGAMVNFIKDVVANDEVSKTLPCNPKQVVKVDILIGGNNETNVSIPVSDIGNEIVNVSKKLPTVYSNAEVTVHLPYITQDDDRLIWERRNQVDEIVTTQLQGVERVTVIPLSQYVVSGHSLNGDFEDTLHMDPKFLLKLLGGKQTIFSFSKN